MSPFNGSLWIGHSRASIQREFYEKPWSPPLIYEGTALRPFGRSLPVRPGQDLG